MGDSIDSGPHSIDRTRVIFEPTGDATLKAVTPDFYEALGEFGDFIGHVLIQRFSFSEPWDMWEMHPEGDEFVYLLEGDTDFDLKLPGQPARTEMTQSRTVTHPATAPSTRAFERRRGILITPAGGNRFAQDPKPKPRGPLVRRSRYPRGGSTPRPRPRRPTRPSHRRRLGRCRRRA